MARNVKVKFVSMINSKVISKNIVRKDCKSLCTNVYQYVNANLKKVTEFYTDITYRIQEEALVLLAPNYDSPMASTDAAGTAVAGETVHKAVVAVLAAETVGSDQNSTAVGLDCKMEVA